MKQLLLSTLLLLAFGVQAQHSTLPQPATMVSALPPRTRLMTLDAANGVEEIHFGADRTTFSRLVQTDANGPVVYYKRKNDRLVFGQVVLHEVLYSFYHSKLALIRLRTPDEASSQAVLRELVARYGYDYRATKLPEQHGLLERLVWVGNSTTLMYTLDMASKEATIIFSNNAMAEEQLREKADAAK